MHSRWLTGRAVGFHLLVVVVVTACLLAGRWQLHAALGGNTLSWAYTVEWPIFAIIAVVAWWYLIHEDPAERAERADEAARSTRRRERREAAISDRGAVRSWREATVDAYEWDEVTDLQLLRVAAAAAREYQAHLDRVEARDRAENRRWHQPEGWGATDLPG